MSVWLLVLSAVLVLAHGFTLSDNSGFTINNYYCGFSGEYCGQSQRDDVYSSSDVVILAWAKVSSNGTLVADNSRFPRSFVKTWKNTGKKVMISVGGGEADTWKKVFASEQSEGTFINSTLSVINNEGLDGIDLYVEGDYSATPKQFAHLINALFIRFIHYPGQKKISLTADCSGVYEGAPVPDPDTANQPYNFVTAVYKLANPSIDFYQVRAYSSWYDGLEDGSLQYLQDVYLHWNNLPSSFCKGCIPIPSFSGIPSNKLVMMVLGSAEARKAEEYYIPSVLRSFKSWMKEKGYQMLGYAVWNSHWDSDNGYQVSQAISS